MTKIEQDKCKYCYHQSHCGHTCLNESCDHCTECGCPKCETEEEEINIERSQN